ncbi:conserved hypothetical protein, HNE_0200 family [Mucilaginibacter gossypiicola]|uniref:Cytochrome c domain-containing protein n=1 Tax=Mucilaginibacter gossypiicola TaxID=551995 RepID=A0A1H8B7Y2_9SPHI|nr:hypothetical protein [Mucilaginibacter gossypiicola]SEM79071.1 conserved hypothetical protein, HNE_0200 family [Mucilaginibacter gossypiicola]
MKFPKRTIVISLLSAFVVIIASTSATVENAGLTGDKDDYIFKPNLSDYHIFKGKMNNLIPSAGFYSYTLATTLFTDYAEKQRLIWLPPGTKMSRINDGLLDFPEGSMIVKTFYYPFDKRDNFSRLHIVETRLLVKSKGKWNTADYKWTDGQSDAQLFPSGGSKLVTYTDKSGAMRSIPYQIPSKKNCVTCHNSNGTIFPIGPKVRNMNFDVPAEGKTENQLEAFQKIGILNHFDVHKSASLPQAFNTDYSVEDQARAYMEINCAHCHNPTGRAKETRLYLSYSLPLHQTSILRDQKSILRKTGNRSMPKAGSTIIHTEGVELIRAYIASLNKTN